MVMVSGVEIDVIYIQGAMVVLAMLVSVWFLSKSMTTTLPLTLEEIEALEPIAKVISKL